MVPKEYQGLLRGIMVSALIHIGILYLINNQGFEVSLAYFERLSPVEVTLTARSNLPETQVPARPESNAPQSGRLKNDPGQERNSPPLKEEDVTPPRPLTDFSAHWMDQGVAEPGRLTVEVLVGSNGRARNVHVLRSTFSEATEALIVSLFHEAEFAPGKIRNQPAEMVAEFEVEIE